MSRIKKPDYPLLITIGILFVFGLLMLSSASTAIAFNRFGDAYYLVKRQILLGALPGALAFFVLLKIDYKYLKRGSLALFILSLILLGLVLVPGIGQVYGGARRWIDLGFATFQPSELMKLSFIIYLASWLSVRSRVIQDWRQGLIPFSVLTLVVLGLVVVQPDLGTTAIIGFIAFLLYFLAGAPLKHLLVLLGAGVASVAALIALAPYRLNRLLIFLEPSLDPQGIGYHINQAFLAIGSGGLWGRGFGRSRAKFQYLPEATGDSIFAVIGEELGFVFTLLFIALFIYLFIRGFKVARSAPDDFGRLLGAGIIIWFTGQALVNISAMIGLLPLTGLPLPFVSYGSSALVVSLAAAGILGNISRYSLLKKYEG